MHAVDIRLMRAFIKDSPHAHSGVFSSKKISSIGAIPGEWIFARDIDPLNRNASGKAGIITFFRPTEF